MFNRTNKDGIEPDPNYDWVPPITLKKSEGPPKGRQCGQCGLKFDYGVTYGYCCGHSSCPMGWGR